jgi:signal transduction histidine kinase
VDVFLPGTSSAARSLTNGRSDNGRSAPSPLTEGEDLALLARVRTAALIALAAGAVFFPVEFIHFPAPDRFWLVVSAGFHTLIASAVLLASFTAPGRRHADGLGMVLIAGFGLNTHLRVYTYTHHQSLNLAGLICLLVGSTVLFSWDTRRTVIVCGIFCLAFSIVGRAAIGDADPFLVSVGALVAGSIIAVWSAHALGQLRTGLARRQSELAALSSRLMSVQEEERRRLSRELHDELGQSLTAVMAYLWLVERQPPEDEVALRARIGEARHLVSKTLSAMRELSQLLRPSVLDDFGLVPSLDGHLKAFAERHQIAISFSADDLPERLPAEVEVALYRITQEALTNVARHAEASRVRVRLAAEAGELRLEVEDDGVGLPRDNGQTRSGTGLVGIRERARALGGTVAIQSESGTRLTVRLPFP